MTTLSLTFGDLLRRHRVAAELTQEELAERAGLSVRAISDLERGARHVPRRGTLQLLLDALVLSARDRAALEAAARRLGGVLAQEGRDPLEQALAALPTAFVGRERELAAVGELLQRPEVRLLTLIGPGGMGKTRLALQVAAAIRDMFQDGIYVVSLASLGDPDLVVSALAEAIGVREQGGRGLSETVQESLGDQHVLLVLDNFEHLLPARSVVGDLLTACPRLTALVTSRAALHLARERTFEVPPLAAPDPQLLPDLAAVGCYDAVRLFCERAQAVKGSFVLTHENAAAVVEICHRLDGLPLAIELAAARVRTLPPRALLTQLSHRLALLTGGALDTPVRHQTLRGAIDWSYTLLEEAEQKLFARLAVFAGGCTLEAAEAVCNDAGDLPLSVLDGLSSLVDKSLVIVEERETADDDAEARFVMLETIREYALERLAAGQEAERLRRRHAAFVLRLIEEAEPHLVGAAQVSWLARLELELDNVRTALHWAVENREATIGLQIASGLWRFWYARGHLTEGRRWLAELVAMARRDGAAEGTEAHGILRVKAMIWAAGLATDQGDYRQAGVLAEEGLQLSRACAHTWGIAFSLSILANVAHNRGDYVRAQSLYEEGLALFQELDDRWGIGLSLNNLGAVARARGDPGQAAALYQESLTMGRETGDLWSIAVVLHNLGEVMQEQGEHGRAIELHTESLALRRTLGDTWGIADSLSALGLVAQGDGNYERATSLYEESLSLYRGVGDTWGSAVCLERLAGMAQLRDQMDQAARLFGAAAGLRERIGHPLTPAERPAYDCEVAAVQAALGEDAFAAAWAAGRLMFSGAE